MAIERERARADFARLPAAPPSVVVDEEPEFNPFLDPLSGPHAELAPDEVVTLPAERQA